MAYDLGDRFTPPSKCTMLLDPGAYQTILRPKSKENTAPFLTNAPRQTLTGAKIWSEAIYFADMPSKIPTCTSLMSKSPRFPYKILNKDDLEELLCRCGLPCECPTEEDNKAEEVCLGKIQKRLFKGQPPRSNRGESLSAPCKNDRGFQILADGSTRRIRETITESCPPFYDTRVNESTQFYRGWKWSKWSSKRNMTSFEVRPGPADYVIEKKPNQNYICAEKLRAQRRKHCKQLRFLDMLQRKNIIENQPGPATYDPAFRQGTELQHLGPKAERFLLSKNEQRPSPTHYNIKRFGDRPIRPNVLCHATLPKPSFFGIKAVRFKPLVVEGPSPASFYPKLKICQYIHCSQAPFNSSSIRFTEKNIENDEDEYDTEISRENNNEKKCPSPTWEFKSKTVRMKPLVKELKRSSDVAISIPSSNKIQRSDILQRTAPFNSSEGRFQPWLNWIPVYGNLKTPGPGYYNLEKPKCLNAVPYGPLSRAERFKNLRDLTPAPNAYRPGGGLETVLETHNIKLKSNILNKHTFHWNEPIEKRKLNYEEREALLFHNAIKILDSGETSDTKIDNNNITEVNTNISRKDVREKLLRCFLYSKTIDRCY